MKKIIGLLFTIYILSACSSYKDVQFKGTENFKIGQLEGKKLSFTFDAKLLNENGYTIKIKPCDLDLFINEQQMGIIHLDKKVKIKRKSETTVTIPITAELSQGALLKLATLKLNKTVSVRLKGTVKGGVFIFSKKEEIDETREISTDKLKLGF